jgi:hypothetical protein
LYESKYMYTLVFKTNIQSDQALKEVNTLLDTNAALLTWSVDTEDVDKVLRVKSTADNSAEIISILKQAGYSCEELPD